MDIHNFKVRLENRNRRNRNRYKYGNVIIKHYSSKEVKGKRENCCDTLLSSFKVLVESKVIKDSQSPLPFKKRAEIDVELNKESN